MTTTTQQPATAPEPGIYPDVPEHEYRAWRVPSQTVLKQARKSMLHARHCYLNPITPTDDMRLGTALHRWILEPKRALREQIPIWKGGRRAGNVWDSFVEDYGIDEQTLYLRESQLVDLEGMYDAVHGNEFFQEWLDRMEGTEVAAVGEIAGLRVKGMCDALTPEPLIDFKSTRSLPRSGRELARMVYNLGYDIQAAMYTRLYQRERFVLAFVENQEPYDIIPWNVPHHVIAAAATELEQICERWRECEATGKWPGVHEGPEPLEVTDWPDYYMSGEDYELSITLGDEEVQL